MNKGRSIFVQKNNQGRSVDTSALIDWAMRLLVETNSQEAIVAAVIVPDSIFARISPDLARFKFYPVTQQSSQASTL